MLLLVKNGTNEQNLYTLCLSLGIIFLWSACFIEDGIKVRSVDLAFVDYLL